MFSWPVFLEQTTPFGQHVLENRVSSPQNLLPSAPWAESQGEGVPMHPFLKN